MKPASIALLVLFALPFFIALDESSVWDANEAFYVQTPREMVERGDWIVPSFNGQPRLNKPPLAYWIVALCYKFFSVSLFGERLIMALAAYGSVLIVFWIGKLLLAETPALLAAGMFATTFRLLMLSRRLLIDVLMIFFLLLAVALFLSFLKSGRRRHFTWAALFLALAFLTKGPVALLPLPFLLLYVASCGQLSKLGRAPWLVSAPVFLLVSSSWFLLLGLKLGWKPVIEFFAQENIGRYVSLEFGPRRGPLYYAGVFLGDFFPWSIFFLAATLAWIRGGFPRAPKGVKAGSASKNPRPRGSSDAGSATLLLLFWILTYLLFFSFAQNKQEHYILPVYPAAALWAAAYLNQNYASRLLAIVVAVPVTVMGLALWLVAAKLFPETSGIWIPPLVLLGVVAFPFHRRMPIVAASLALFYFSAFGIYLKPLEEYKPIHHLARAIQEHAAKADGGSSAGWRAGYYNFTAPSLAFYLNRPILELYDQKKAIGQLQGRVPVYLIVVEEDYQALARASRVPLEIVDVRPKLYTTARVFAEGFKRGRNHRLRSRWTRPIYLVTNRAVGSVGGDTGL